MRTRILVLASALGVLSIVCSSPSTSTLAPDAEPFTDRHGVPMVLVPAGPFEMGSENGDANESPVHTVYLDAYYIDRYEVTNARYADCVDAMVCDPPESAKSSAHGRYYGNLQYGDYPVIYVSWEDASVYCAWREGRLPTEAEWEKAARGEKRGAYPWGDRSPDCTLANYAYCADDTTPVGSYPEGVSPYGVHDMAGNVSEWVADWYDGDYYADSPASNPQGSANGEFRAVRGGSWVLFAGFIRTAFRSWNAPGFGHLDLGFRCARTP